MTQALMTVAWETDVQTPLLMDFVEAHAACAMTTMRGRTRSTTTDDRADRAREGTIMNTEVRTGQTTEGKRQTAKHCGWEH